MQTIKRKPLLSSNNVKTMKGEKQGYKTYILYMSPYNFNTKGINVCSHASAGCAEACLVGSGMGGIYEGVMQGRKNKTEYFLSNRKEFLEQLVSEIEKLVIKNERDNLKSEVKYTLTFRLNGTADVRFEKFKIKDNKNIFELFPDIQFYDYTKNHIRFNQILPSNYHLTFSRHETNHDKAMELLKEGVNVAIVFKTVPETYMGYKVINGDVDDLRFLDDSGVVVGLKYKNMTGKGADNKLAFASGFALVA